MERVNYPFYSTIYFLCLSTLVCDTFYLFFFSTITAYSPFAFIGTPDYRVRRKRGKGEGEEKEEQDVLLAHGHNEAVSPPLQLPRAYTFKRFIPISLPTRTLFPFFFFLSIKLR